MRLGRAGTLRMGWCRCCAHLLTLRIGCGASRHRGHGEKEGQVVGQSTRLGEQPRCDGTALASRWVDNTKEVTTHGPQTPVIQR